MKQTQRREPLHHLGSSSACWSSTTATAAGNLFQQHDIDQKFEQAKQSVACMEREQAKEQQDQMRAVRTPFSIVIVDSHRLMVLCLFYATWQEEQSREVRTKCESETKKRQGLQAEKAKMIQHLKHAQQETRAMADKLKIESARTDFLKQRVGQQISRQSA